MPRKNLDQRWGESRAITVRLAVKDRRALAELVDAWGCTQSDAVRRALQDVWSRRLTAAPRSAPRALHSLRSWLVLTLILLTSCAGMTAGAEISRYDGDTLHSCKPRFGWDAPTIGKWCGQPLRRLRRAGMPCFAFDSIAESFAGQPRAPYVILCMRDKKLYSVHGVSELPPE